jgi:hypothetical protein
VERCSRELSLIGPDVEQRSDAAAMNVQSRRERHQILVEMRARQPPTQPSRLLDSPTEPLQTLAEAARSILPEGHEGRA